MAKIGLTKLSLKKNTNLIQLNWNEQIIEIKEYLPLKEKLEIIDKIVKQSMDDGTYVIPCRFDLFKTLEIIYAYTNINFTDKQKEDLENLYDLLVGSGLWTMIEEQLKKTNDYLYIIEMADKTIHEMYKYRDSVLGVLDAVNTDYSNLSFDAENIQKNLADPNNLTLLKDVVTKLG